MLTVPRHEDLHQGIHVIGLLGYRGRKKVPRTSTDVFDYIVLRQLGEPEVAPHVVDRRT